MTFNYRIEHCAYHINEETPYQSVFSSEEYHDLVALCKQVFGKNFTNGSGVRLDACIDSNGKSLLQMSAVRFYDFLLSNFVLFNYGKIHFAANEQQAAALEKLMQVFTADGYPTSVEDIAGRTYLANTIAISLLVRDKTGAFLLTKRSNNVGISSGFVSVTVTGAVDWDDLRSADPIRFCCCREMLEEMNYTLDSDCVHPFMIVCGEKKLQPIVLVDATVDDIHELVAALTHHKGFAEENSGYAVCSSADIRKLLNDTTVQITEAARTHLENAICHGPL